MAFPASSSAHQPDLQLPIAEKLARLEAILDELARHWQFVTLGEVAADVQRSE